MATWRSRPTGATKLPPTTATATATATATTITTTITATETTTTTIMETAITTGTTTTAMAATTTATIGLLSRSTCWSSDCYRPILPALATAGWRTQLPTVVWCPSVISIAAAMSATRSRSATPTAQEPHHRNHLAVAGMLHPAVVAVVAVVAAR